MIKKIGKTYKVDKEDYLIADQDISNVKGKWLEVMNAVIDRFD